MVLLADYKIPENNPPVGTVTVIQKGTILFRKGLAFSRSDLNAVPEKVLLEIQSVDWRVQRLIINYSEDRDYLYVWYQGQMWNPNPQVQVAGIVSGIVYVGLTIIAVVAALSIFLSAVSETVDEVRQIVWGEPGSLPLIPLAMVFGGIALAFTAVSGVIDQVTI